MARTYRTFEAWMQCTLTLRERELVDAMKVQTGLVTDADLMRTALYRFAAHLDQHVDTAMFRVRGGRDKHARAAR